MAGKKPAGRKEQEQRAATPKTNTQGDLQPKGFDIKTWAMALVVVLVTGIVFSGVTKLQWTNWDDDEYVYENDNVMKGDYKAIFSSAVNNNYNPLPVAMHAWEWKQVAGEKDLAAKAKFFHINNLWMHLVCTFLVFWLMQMLGLKPLWAMAAALLFGIHPMRVESVAWITERKDVMFGMFYVGALITYLQSVKAGSKDVLMQVLWLVATMVLFTLSSLSKIQAVSLPLSMLAIDWYLRRKWSVWMLLEKVPFFLGAAVIGIVGVKILASGETLDVDQTFSLAERVPLGLTAYAAYVIKALVPFQTCTFYPYPKTVELLYWIGMLVAILMVAGAAFLFKLSRETTFGMAFFTVNIMFLLQILGAGSAFMADRFSYIAYIGLFFAMAMVAQRVSERSKNLQPVMMGGFGVLLLASAGLTWNYVPAWENSDTLWTDVIDKYPRKVVLAYVNRGQYLRRDSQKPHANEVQSAFQLRSKKQIDQAFEDFNTAVELQPKYHLGYLNRGNIYFDRNQNDEALADYTKVIEIFSPLDSNGRIDPAIPGAFSNRGAIYSRKNMHQEALADYKVAIKFNPNDKNTWNNRAVTYFTLGDYPKAVADFDHFLTLEPENAGVINARGVCFLRMAQYEKAKVDFTHAIQINPKDVVAIGNRAYAYANLGDKAKALEDVRTCESMGQKMDPAFVAGLQQ